MAALQWDSARESDPAAVRLTGPGGGGATGVAGWSGTPSKIKTALLLVRKII